MGPRLSSFTPYRALLFFATALALASWLFLIDTNLSSHRDQFQESDYIMTFYVAGHLAATGQADQLYPAPDALSFINSPFDQAAHRLLPHLPKSSTGAYMYIPLIAGFFAPFSWVKPNLSLLLWQVISVLALGLCCRMLGNITQFRKSEIFFLSFLYAPVFLTLWGGQLGLTFGLVPLCAGYALLFRQRPFAAGLVWSLLLLKPQYFPAAALVTLALATVGRCRAIAGLCLGVVGLLALTTVIFSPSLTLQWLLSHKVSDAIFSSGVHRIPSHLIVGLPANLMILFPVSERSAVKLPLYLSAAVLWLVGLWYCRKLCRSRLPEPAQWSFMLVIGLLISSLALPHLLYYDLVILIPAGVILLGNIGQITLAPGLRPIVWFGWIAVTAYMPLFLIFGRYAWLPLSLEFVLLALLSSVLWQVHHACQNEIRSVA